MKINYFPHQAAAELFFLFFLIFLFFFGRGVGAYNLLLNDTVGDFSRLPLNRPNVQWSFFLQVQTGMKHGQGAAGRLPPLTRKYLPNTFVCSATCPSAHLICPVLAVLCQGFFNWQPRRHRGGRRCLQRREQRQSATTVEKNKKRPVHTWYAALHLDSGTFLCFLSLHVRQADFIMMRDCNGNTCGWFHLCIVQKDRTGVKMCRRPEAPAVCCVFASSRLTDKLEWLILEKTLHVTLQDRVSKKILNSYSLLVVYPLERSLVFFLANKGFNVCSGSGASFSTAWWHQELAERPQRQPLGLKFGFDTLKYVVALNCSILFFLYV